MPDVIPPARPAEQYLIQHCAATAKGRVLTSTQGRAQLALSIAQQSTAEVVCHMLDMHHARLACEACQDWPVDVCCQSDPPAGPFDQCFVPLGRQGEAELVRERLQAFWGRLRIGGQMTVAVENPRDSWVAEQLQRFVKRVRREATDRLAVYQLVKRQELKKVKVYDCQFAFRDKDRLLQVTTRPGVFSHRRVDAGARQLLNYMEIAAGQRVLEIGCGAGVVSLAAAARQPSASVLAIDSYTRAVECTSRNAADNNLHNLQTRLTDQGDVPAHEFDVVLGNPPYYADQRIAHRFLQIALHAAKPGGEVLFVGKQPDWYEDVFAAALLRAEVWQSKGYVLARGIAE